MPAFLASLPPEVELVVVDASDDGTAEIIESVRPENTVVIPSRAGLVSARQLGAEAAAGEWLLFTDADVRFDPSYFPALATRPVTGGAFYGIKCEASHPRYSWLFRQAQTVLHWSGIPAASGSNMGIRRQVFREVGGFRTDLTVNEDTELMMRVARAGHAVERRPDLVVHSIDARRLTRGATRKAAHSIARGAVLFLDLHVRVPESWLSGDWGYWRDSGRRADSTTRQSASS